MPGMKQVLVVAFGVLTLGSAVAAIPECNTVRTHAVEVGPQANRILVGFRATATNAVAKQMQVRALPQVQSAKPLHF